MNAAQAAEYIAPFIKSNWPKDRDKLFRILSLVHSRAWKEGKWYGMTREYTVPVLENNTLITPPGYNVLLKINLDAKPTIIRDKYFQFHRNGTGSISECCGKNWCGDVHDLGPEPVLFQPYQIPSCICDDQTKPCIQLAFKSLGCENDDVSITVTGFYPNELNPKEKGEACPKERVYTYKKETSPGKTEICGCRKDTPAKEGKKPVNGATVKPDENLQLLDLYWGEIESIKKTTSRNPIEVYAVYGDNKVRLIARLEPWQTEAHYRRYHLPDSCSTPCVHGLFKISQPERILDDSQLMLISDDEALLLLAKGIHMTYYESEDVDGERYILRGIKALDDQLRENASNADIPIQVSGPMFQSVDSLEPLNNY